MSAQPRVLAETLALCNPEEQEWCGFLSSEEIARRLNRHFARSLRHDRTVLELACLLEIPPSQLARHLETSPHREQVLW